MSANSMHFARISKLKSGYAEMEIKKNQMDDALKSVKVSIREQEAQHKADIIAQEVEIEKFTEENWDLLNKNKELERKVKELESIGKEMEKELQGLQEQEGTQQEDLAKACLSLSQTFYRG
ncbi:hypothetical protein JCGZ_10439 [Jatropha curcas]|uniref:Uncharacterized protein n=1 Tax=Jatropha curcas TaxID=180498 RepID=A0A067KLE5_JATCU|nr:hypothetical protein JCGZ_10439 [Jatropha curcas]